MIRRPEHLSLKGAKFIAEFEGYRANWYNDAVGVRTIGFGHTGPLPHGFTAPLDYNEALRLLQHDAEECAKAVRTQIHPPLRSQSRFDAIVSLCFNLGPGIIGPSHDIGRALQGRLRRGAADAILEYDHAGGHALAGLTRRRQRERKLFLTGRYS